MREGTDKYDDRETGGYSYAEKLALVAQDVMDPKEIGLTSRAEAVREITGEEKPSEKLGDFVTFQVSVVPIELRAHWARQEASILTEGETAREWEQKWIEKNKDTYAVQGDVHSGHLHAKFGQTFSDPIKGFCVMLRNVADMLETKYEELKKNDPNPIITRKDQQASKKAVETSDE